MAVDVAKSITRLLRYGTALLRSFSVDDNTPRELTCGRSVQSSRRCALANHYSPVTLRLMRSSRSSGLYFRFGFFFFFFSKDILKRGYRLLGTPDETIWPGVTSYPDFKPTFPKWKRDPNRALVQGLDENGLDLLNALLEYDPARRISAKQACMHPYFQYGSSYYSGRDRRNGYH